ncbi:MAG: HDOD domain-containing protein [Desulfobacterales bacterium]|nr:HDOD domain-containing protein [Desulfobacterales bacterium]
MKKKADEITINKVIRRLKNMPSIPTVITKVSEILDDPRSCAADFGRVISGDQALTAKLLRLVNSAFYGFPGKIDTVSRAVTIIGFRPLRELVLGTSILNMFKGLGDNAPLGVQDFWKHSMVCGIASRVFGIYKREEVPERFFVAGLLHDIGRMALLESCPEQYNEVFAIVKEESCLVTEAETAVFGFTHAEVGKKLLLHWQLPSSLANAVGFHHDAERPGRSSSLADVIHVADIITHASSLGASGEQFIPPLNPHAWGRLGLKMSILEPAMEKIYEQFESIADFMLVEKQED